MLWLSKKLSKDKEESWQDDQIYSRTVSSLLNLMNDSLHEVAPAADSENGSA